jgi:hypothetical protein
LAFSQLPEEKQQKQNKKIITPFRESKEEEKR